MNVDRGVSRCAEHNCKDCYEEKCGDVFLDEMVLLHEVKEAAEECQDEVGPPTNDAGVDQQQQQQQEQQQNEEDGSSKGNPNQNAKAVVFSLRNQVGGLVRALRVFKVRRLGQVLFL